MNLEPLLIRLDELRTSLDECKQLIKGAESALHEEIAGLYSSRDTLEGEIKQAEMTIREITLRSWVATGSPPHPAVNVRKMLKYKYLNEEVVAWVIENAAEHPDLLLLLTVDRVALEAGVKSGAIQCPHVYPQYEPQPTISTNLKKVLGGSRDE